jgi:hypothetical protein
LAAYGGVASKQSKDHAHGHPLSTPIQRALRLKKAALEAKGKTPGAAGSLRKQVAGVAAGASKPWMKK